MLAILNSLNAHNFLIFKPILMILLSKFMDHRALYDKTYLPLGLLSPLTKYPPKLTIEFFFKNIWTWSKFKLFYKNDCKNAVYQLLKMFPLH